MLNANDDMDEFIKKAAAEYPLKTGKGNWDDVVAALADGTPPPPANNGYKKFLWLLLLLLIAGLAIYNHQQSATPIIAVQMSKANTQITKDKPGEKNKIAVINSDKNSSGITEEAIIKKRVVLQLQAKTITKITRQLNKKDEIKINKTGEIIASNFYQKSTTDKNNFDQSIINNSTDTSTLNPMKNSAILKNYVQAENTTNSKKNEVVSDINPVASTQKDTVLNSNKKDTAAVKKAKDKKASPLKQKGFYAGAAIYADVTTVKFQSVKHIGDAYSFLAGYRFNNTWSAETGLMLDTKKYYTTGKYFDKSKAGLSADYNIHFLNGDCKMFEVPLNIKFDFKSKKHSGFYAITGLSSYFMKKEKYNYFVTHNSEPAIPGYFRDNSYKNKTTNLFAIANVSGGYQFIFKNNSSLRIEPYLKIPVSGVGVGKLPLTSAGISAGYTLHLK